MSCKGYDNGIDMPVPFDNRFKLYFFPLPMNHRFIVVLVCVCVCERERERERTCVCFFLVSFATCLSTFRSCNCSRWSYEAQADDSLKL